MIMTMSADAAQAQSATYSCDERQATPCGGGDLSYSSEPIGVDRGGTLRPLAGETPCAGRAPPWMKMGSQRRGPLVWSFGRVTALRPIPPLAIDEPVERLARAAF